tara:strand:+ start:89 stop:1102 length:1014 start_codon:yes stop_codon:yes gene_type:complete
MLLNNRIASLELLRFLASISVVIFHYKNVLVGTDYKLVAELPFNNLLNLLHIYGYYGVHIFFSISGFIFAYTYLDKDTSAKTFFVNRFARLYPLHFLTLTIIIFLEFLDPIFFNEYNQKNGIFNDLYHFFLQIFFISYWGLENGHSFNTPIWSVSVEIIMYIMFFLLIKSLKLIVNFSIILLFLLLYKFSPIEIRYSEFAILFFSGVLIYQIIKFNRMKIQLLISLFILILSLLGNFKILIFAPSLVMFIVLIEKYVKKQIRPIFVNLGSITYSTYLIHYPILLVILVIGEKYPLMNQIYFNDLFFILFLTFLVLTSLLIFKYFERPLNKLLRKRLY